MPYQISYKAVVDLYNTCYVGL